MAGRLRYEPALDGLRAIAVVAVLLYHGEVAWLPGGFLGVDVFFGLSGYLITTLLLRDGDLRTFWVRRARRLLPALVLVLLAVAGYAAVRAAPEELARIRGDGLASLLYVANWRLILVGDSYFEQFATPSPLRHLWSLGIEEQWYLLWPLALGLLRRTRRWLVPALLVAAAASAVVMAVLYEPADPSRAYYGTDARAQALLLGAVLAVVRWRPPRWLGVAGLAVVLGLFAVAHDTDAWLYRGGFTISSLATLAVVGTRPGVLSWWPLPVIGRISYGLYLWHWPVYVALREPLVVEAALTFVLASASYVLVEQPFREGRVRLPAPAVPAVFAAVAGLLVLATVGATVPSAPTAASRPVTPPAAVDVGPPRVLVVGDSVALTLSADVPPSLVDGAEVTSEAILGCGVIRVPRWAGPLLHEPAEDCRTWPSRWRRAIARVKPDVAVLLLGAWEVFDAVVAGERLPFGSPAHQTLLRRELDRALSVLGAGRTEVLVLTTPCFAHFDEAEFREGSERNEPERVAWVNRQLRAAAAGRPDVRIVDLGAFLCPGGELRRSIGGVQVRHDDGVHLAADGLGVVWRWLLPEVLSATRRARSER